MVYNRNCPRCNTNINYTNYNSYWRAKSKERKCVPCSIFIRIEHNRRFPKTILERNCPKCNKLLLYKTYRTWWWSKKYNLLCQSCKKTGKTMPVGFSEKISKLVRGNRNPMYGKKHSDATKLIISKKNKGNKARLGQPHLNISKEKMRLAIVNRVKKYGAHSRNFNPIACEFIDKYGKENNYHFQHALNGGEINKFGYFADGYDIKNNIWFEYDESIHYTKTGELKLRDIKRMNIIKEKLNCKFIRYNEKLNEIKEY